MTTTANADVAHVHDRMPVVVEPDDFSAWLDCRGREPRDVACLLRPAQEDLFEAIPVSDRVNKVANVGPDIQEQFDPPAQPVDSRASSGNAAKNLSDGQMSLF